MRVQLAAAAFLMSCLAAGVARADGAFPDSTQILLPADKPNEIIVGTNFGLLISEDQGKSWQWVCEQEIAPCAKLYTQAPAPNDAIFTVATAGLVSLGSDACGYSVASGLTGIDTLVDMFIDPSGGKRAFALATLSGDGGVMSAGLFASTDGAQSFSGPTYVTPVGSTLRGVEIAKSDANTVYLTQYQYSPAATTVLRSHDGGGSFTPYDQSASIGRLSLRIAAVDPTNPETVYFRANNFDTQQESLVITSDGGMTTHLAQMLPLPYQMSTFLRRSDGTLLLVGLQRNASGSFDCNGDPPWGMAPAMAYRSSDGGKTFSAWANAPHLRGLGERGGVLYGATDNFADGFAVGMSSDGGNTWKPLLKYVDIKGPLGCQSVQSTCAEPWIQLQTTFGISGDMGTMTHKSGGCSCSYARGSGTPLATLAFVLLALAWWARRRISR